MYVRHRCLTGSPFFAIVLWFLAAVGVLAAEHPCEEEVKSACPDRPGSEIGACLKDSNEHEAATEISSECTDFMALNKACKEDIVEFCNEAFFSSDTTLCLTQWTNQDNLSPKCKGVIAWAVPKAEDDAGPTDELGLSEKDYAEKKAWQAKRKGARAASIERMKDEPAHKEKEQREMDELKQNDPEEYQRRLVQQKQIKKQNDEIRKRERLQAAAEQRKWEEENPQAEVEEDEAEKVQRKKTARKRQGKPEPTNWLPYVLGGLGVAFVGMNVLNFFTSKSEEDKEDKDE